MTKEGLSVTHPSDFQTLFKLPKSDSVYFDKFQYFLQNNQLLWSNEIFFLAPVPVMQSEECRKFRWCIFTYQSRKHLLLQSTVHEK